MALDFYLQCKPWHNFLLINSIDNKLANAALKAPTKSSGFFVLTFRAFFYNLTPASTLKPAFIFVLASTILSTNNKLFKKFIEVCLAAQGQLPATVLPLALALFEPCKQSFKVCFSKLYFDNLFMNCYNFCQ